MHCNVSKICAQHVQQIQLHDWIIGDKAVNVLLQL